MLLRKVIYGAFVLLLCSFSIVVAAQAPSAKGETAEEFRRKALTDLDNFTDSAKQDQARFREQANKEYAEFLKNAWVVVQASRPVKSYKVPKPAAIPVLEEKKQSGEIVPEPAMPEPKPVEISEPAKKPAPEIVEPVPDSKPVPVVIAEPIKKKPDLTEAPAIQNQVKVNFYKLEINAPAASNEWPTVTGEINNADIADYWRRASESDMKNWLTYISSLKDLLGGGDYAVYLAVNRIAEKYYSDPVTARLFCWYSLMQNGYDVKIGYTQNKVYLLVYSRNEIFGKVYFTLNGKKYYALDGEPEPSIHICNAEYKLTSHTLNPDVAPALALKSELVTRCLSFTFNNRYYNFNLSYCPQHVDYLFKYPQLTYSDYLASEAGEWFDKQLRQQFSPILANMSEYNQIAFLLSFVQHAFEYKDDEEQFGREKWDFPEEMIRYPYSDCDDRAIFFSYLVKKLTGHQVIGLLYENHICTAVRFNENVSGDKILYKNAGYVICDPTYVGASVGKSMAEYRNVTPKVCE